MTTGDDSYICKDSEGNVFLSLEKTDEITLSEDPQLTHCLAVVKMGDDYLLGWNKWRNRYEIFGGLYGITIPVSPVESIYERINDKEEITKLALYSRIKNKEPVAAIDEKLLEYYP